MWTTLVGMLTGPIVDAIMTVIGKYLQAGVDKEKIKADVKLAVLNAFKEVAKSDNEALTKTYAAFMDAATKSVLMQRVWACVCISQLVVLLWHQLGIPAFVLATGIPYPSSGSLVEWAYALLGFCIGAGPLVLKSQRKLPTV